jgi:O-antigen ligase
MTKNGLQAPTDLTTTRNPNFAFTTLLLAALLSCAIDIPNIRIGSNTIRIANITLPIIFFIYLKLFGMKVSKVEFRIGVFLVATLIPSLLLSTDIWRSGIYLGWVLFHLVFVFALFKRMAETHAQYVVSLWMGFFRFAILVAILQKILGIQDRASFLLYEPSYFAIFLIPYLCLVAFQWQRSGRAARTVDYLLIVLVVLATQSASLLLWILASFLAALIVHRRFARIAILFFLALLATLMLHEFNDRARLYIDQAIAADNSADLAIAFLSIGGNRLQRVITAWDVFWAHPWVGIGLGNFENYSRETLPLAEYTEILSVEDFDVGLPATNILLEISATTGLVGLSGFLVFWGSFLIRPAKLRKYVPLFWACLVTFLALMFESTYLRLYVWALWGIYSGCISSELKKHISPGGRHPRKLEETLEIKGS